MLQFVSCSAAQRCYRAQFSPTSWATRRRGLRFSPHTLAILYTLERTCPQCLKSYLIILQKATLLLARTQQNTSWTPLHPTKYIKALKLLSHPTGSKAHIYQFFPNRSERPLQSWPHLWESELQQFRSGWPEIKRKRKGATCQEPVSGTRSNKQYNMRIIEVQ